MKKILSGNILKTTAWVLWFLGAVLALWTVRQHPEWAEPIFTEPVKVQNQDSQTPKFERSFVADARFAKVHSASITRLSKDRLLAAWFAGSVEGGKDVKIYTAHYQGEQWSEARAIVEHDVLTDDLHRLIRRIGNPLVYMDSRGQLWCFFVTTSMGGWSTASINLMFSGDGGSSWSSPRRLITSPFLNISTLVRNAPLELEDGGLLLPIYHELFGRFPELLRLSIKGQVVDKKRIGTAGIQPVLTQANNGSWYAFVRSRTGEVESYISNDGTRSWKPGPGTGLANPDSAIVVVKVAPDLWMSVGNNNSNDRSDLTLAFTDNLPGDWRGFYRLEYALGQRFSYPAIVQGQDGLWHLVYSWRETRVRHVIFNQAWLDTLQTFDSPTDRKK